CPRSTATATSSAICASTSRDATCPTPGSSARRSVWRAWPAGSATPSSASCCARPSGGWRGASSRAAHRPRRGALDARRAGQAFTLDLLGEACLSDAEADVYQARYVDLVQTLGREAPHW